MHETQPISRLHRDGVHTSVRFTLTLLGLLSLAYTTGCYAPLRSPAIPATCLSDAYRMPERSFATELNLASLSIPAAQDYILGPNDTLEVSLSGLSDPGPKEQVRPVTVRIMSNGKVRLPLAGEVEVGGMNLSEAQQAIDEAYSPDILKSPKTSIVLVERATFNIPVIGELTNPGVHSLPRYENDIANALALAGGRTPFAAEVVEVHRRMPEFELVRRVAASSDSSDPQSAAFPAVAIDPAGAGMLMDESTKVVLRIPLKSGTPAIIADNQVYPQEHLSVEDITLRQGDVVVVPRQPDEVFFVVGLLNEDNVVNFRVSDLDRRLGNAFLLPKDRDVDVVTAVAMAGYIDPIDSPTTVTVHRSVPGAPPMLIRVDLIAARYDWNENVYVQPGDIIYLNPDAAWWSRRMFDRIAPELLLAPYREAMFRWINPRARLR